MTSQHASPSPSRGGAVLRWLRRNRWLIVIAVVALVIRLHWNLEVHPIGDYIGSDMRGYNSRAEQFLAEPFKPREYHAFFPYGTHYLVALLKAIFGKENFPAIASCYALMGTLVVIFSYQIAALVSKRRWLPPAVGLFLAFDYPLISLGGYMLSEIPMAVFATLATIYLLKLVRDGKSRYALATGVAVSLATIMRPQILLSIALFGLAWLAYRKTAFSRVKFRHLLYAGLPLALTLAFSSWRVQHHTGRRGLISENGTFNQVFGHCHAKMITAKGKSTIKFGPPPLIQLHNRAKKHPKAFVKLDPAISPELHFKGYIADKKKLKGFLRECWKRRGLRGQIKYTSINAILLVAYNTMWPDSGRGAWRETAKWWGTQHLYYLTLPAILGMLTIFRRKTAGRHGILAIHLWALLFTAAIFFGDARLRGPYDPFIVILAFEIYAFAGAWIWRHLSLLLARVRGLRSGS
ncbi:MAG TPA: phospholipid carrier-dependent glycosyltransferase [Nannocystis exedens]|nr:phospholipid carrier-dependent glycosyltransferase [Nannocystis exedens]